MKNPLRTEVVFTGTKCHPLCLCGSPAHLGMLRAADPQGRGQKGPRPRCSPSRRLPPPLPNPPAAGPMASFFISVEELTSITVLTSLDAATTGNTARLTHLCPRRRKR